MLRQFRWSLPLVLLAIFASACVGRVRQPEVRLAGVKVGGIGLRGGQLIAQVEITNPNGFALEADRVTYDLKVSDPASSGDRWIDFAKGEFSQRVRVGGKDTEVFEVPIDFTYTAVSGALRSIMDRGTFDYQVRGDVRLREPIGRQLPYRHQGNVSLSGIR